MELTLRTPMGSEVTFTVENGDLAVQGPVGALAPADKRLALVWFQNKTRTVVDGTTIR